MEVQQARGLPQIRGSGEERSFARGAPRASLGAELNPWRGQPLTCRMSDAYVKGGRTSAFL